MAIPDFTDRSIAQLVSLEGRVAVVTGGARGTGAGIVRRLAEAGAALVIADGDGAEAELGARAVAARGQVAIATGLQVDDESSVVQVAELAVREFGGLHIWV